MTGNGLFTLFEALSGAEVWKKSSGYCHGSMWRWLGGSVLSCEKTACYSLRLDGKEEVEIVSQNFGHICVVCLLVFVNFMFVFSTGKREITKTSGLGFSLAARFLACSPPLLHYGLHPDDFGLSVKLQSGRGKRGDYKPNSLSMKGKDWDDRFFHAVLVLHRKPFTNLLSLC